MNESPIEEKDLDRLRYKEMCNNLMAELSLTHAPVAVKFFYTEAELDYFKKRNHYHLPTKPMDFCQCEHTARKKEQTIYSELQNLQCNSSAYSFVWTRNNESTSSTKQYLNKGVFGIAIAPLGEARFIADTINFYCDSPQADTLIDAWTAVSGVAPWRPNTLQDSASCNCSVFVHNKNLATIGPVCPSSCDKHEGDKVNVILPADHLKHTVDQLLSGKMSLRSSPFSRSGDGVFRYVSYE